MQAGVFIGSMGLSDRYLEKAMQELVRAGILKGVRGPRGGYLLARDPSDITVGQIVRAAERLGRKTKGDFRIEVEAVRKLLSSLMNRERISLLAALDVVTLAEVVGDRTKQSGSYLAASIRDQRYPA